MDTMTFEVGFNRKKRGFLSHVVFILYATLPGMIFGQGTTLPTQEVRSQVCLNGTWSFTPDGGSQTTILVPSTWRLSADSPFEAFTYPNWTGGGTYTRPLSVPASMSGKVIKVDFEAVRYQTTVKVNNTQVGTNSDGFLPFEFKINNQITGSNDVLTVVVGANSTTPIGVSGDYERHRGIWQDVWLKAYPLVYVDNTFFVKTSFRNNQISCDIPIRNEDAASRTFFIRNFVTDGSGAIVLTFDAGSQTLAAGASATYTASSAWANPHLWFPQDPYLYTIHTVLYDGATANVVDWKHTRFGFKEMYIVNGTQFLLNGKRAYLRGDAHHYHDEYQQPRAYFEAMFTAMKSWGVNYFRAHTLPYDPVMLNVADSMGMMILDESAIYGSDGDDDCTADCRPHLQRFIERDRNHPSVILWSVSNELSWKTTQMGLPNYLVQYDSLAKAVDPTRVAYTEGDDPAGNVVESVHYFDFNHCGPDNATPPIQAAGKVHIMGEYCNYMIPCFGDSGTGACGYETKCQDYGTGYWTHGEMARDQTKALQAQTQYGGYLSWSMHWFANRCQPFFNASTHAMTWPDLAAPGAKPQQINPYMWTINWADPDLPLNDPLPWFYLYSCYYKEVRCSDLMSDSKSNNRNFYSGMTFSKTFDLAYETFADANHLKCEIVRKSDGAVLYTTDLTAAPWNNLVAGTRVTNQTVGWVAPAVTGKTPVQINRSFYNGAQLSYTCTLDGAIYPKFTSAQVSGLSGKKVVLLDAVGTTKAVLDNIGLTYTQVSDLSTVTNSNCDVLVIGDKNATTGLNAGFAINGGRVLCLQQTAKPSLPINLPPLISGTQSDVQFLLNGAKHQIFNGIDQNDLSYWANNVATANNVYDRPSTPENIRVLLAANNDGAYAPILEVPAGNGTYLLSQMEIIAQYANEPVAGALLVNMLNYLGGYTPVSKAKTGLIAAAGPIKSYYDSLGLRYDVLSSSPLPDLSAYTVLIIDGTSATIAASLSGDPNKTALTAFVNNGGKVMVCQVTSSTVGSYNTLIGAYPLTLSTPTEKQRCIKCAVTWRHKTTTTDPVRYGYLNFQPPFEPDTDALLLGLNNKDFDWTTNELNNAVKAAGSYPNVNELIAPRRIDWATLVANHDEKSSPVQRAKYQDDWYINRTPVLVKLKQGNGFWLINEILLESGGAGGKRIGNLLLTNLGASVGSTNTYYNLSYSLLNPSTAIARQVAAMQKDPGSSLRLMPNGSLKYTAPKAGTVEFALYNVKGQTVSRFTKKTAEGSAYLTEWNVAKLARGGMYFISMKMDGKRLAVCKVASY
jgi:beta-galactosidase